MSEPDLPPVTADAFGFTIGQRFVAWQTVSEIWGYKADRLTTDEAFLEFASGGRSISVSEEQPGFHALETAMIAAFPGTSAWRQAVLEPPFARNGTLLYRRA
jgi:hypothetical protein